MVAHFGGRRLDARYLGYFDYFNRQLFYEAHDVLEDLWLLDRHGADGDFYKGLIQLAGAFVHLQKDRLRPAEALFKLADANLRKYPAVHHATSVSELLALIDRWRASLAQGDYDSNPLRANLAPVIPIPE